MKLRALALALTATATASLAAAAPPRAPKPGPVPPAANEALAHDVLAQLVAIRSVHDIGTAAVASVIADRLRAGGFSGDDLQVVADPKYPNQVNVVARLRGHRNSRPSR